MPKKKLSAGELRSKILSSKDTKSEIMFIAEWDVDILITSMTLAERKKLRESSSSKMTTEGTFADMDPEQLEAGILISNVKDLDGNPIFTKEDAAELMKKNSAVTTKIASKILELSGMSPEARKEVANRFPGR